jgi:hypothetical protein
MAETKAQVDPARPFELPEAFRRAERASWHPALLALLEAPTVTLDGAAVRVVDGPSLEGLTSFVVQRRGAGRTTRWVAVSAELRSSAAVLGLVELLGLEVP